jgi:flavodoxin I
MEDCGMKIVVVYDSVHGNTKAIAEAAAEALKPFGAVSLSRPGVLPRPDWKSVDLLLVGSPTLGGRPTPAIREFLDGIPAGALQGAATAAFDTRMDMWVARIFGYASVRIASALTARGGREAAAPEGFLVKGREGPLREGEAERAAAWAKRLPPVAGIH